MPKVNSRIHALDFARALSVLLLFLTFVPEGPLYGSYVTHAPWFGYAAIDFAFPAFVTLSGTSMALSGRNRVHWQRLLRRFAILIVLGLIFNCLVLWQFNLSLLRFTGVLQLLAVVGIMTALITRISAKWFFSFTAGLVIMGIYLSILLYTGRHFPGGLPQPDHNLSGLIDPLIFSKNHIYSQGNAGYDPEGIFTIFSAIGSSLLGYSAGLLLRQNKVAGNSLKILVIAVVLLALTPVLSSFIPVNKRLWTPSFVTLTSGSTLLVLAVSHLIWDFPIPILKKLRAALYWIFESVGRNAILLYFGPSLIFSILHHLTLTVHGNSFSLFQFFYDWLNTWSSNPQLGFITVYTVLWVLLAIFLHWRKKYLTV